MLIKDLPQDLKELALLRQKEQGNEPNENLLLNMDSDEGNFMWSDTPEGGHFWSGINIGIFPKSKQLIYEVY